MGARGIKAATLVVVLALAGCAGTTEQTGSNPPVALTRAEDQSTTRQDDGWHTHNLWGKETKKVLFDGLVQSTVAHNHQFDEPPRDQHTHGCDEAFASTSQGGSIRFSLPGGEVVPPGTDELQFQFQWTDPSITSIRFRYRPPGEYHPPGAHDHQRFDGYTDGGVAENGETLLVRVLPEMADNGHAFLSRWAFYICADSGETLSLAEGNVQITITAVKAEELPLEPPHPDHWGDRSTLRLAQDAWAFDAAAAGGKGLDIWHQVPVAEGAIVPPGTNQLHATLWYNVSAPADDTAFLLYHKNTTTPDWVYEWTLPTEDSGGVAQFRIPLRSKGMTDSHYAAVSDWDFWVRVISDTHRSMPLGAGEWSAPHSARGDIHLQIDAVAPTHASPLS